MNSFVNHQITKNVIFVEVENMLVDAVYGIMGKDILGQESFEGRNTRNTFHAVTAFHTCI